MKIPDWLKKNETRIRKGVKVASKLADLALLAAKNPGPLAAVALTARALETWDDLRPARAVKRFGNWNYTDMGDFTTVGRLLAKYPDKIYHASPDGVQGSAFYVAFNGVKFGWIEHNGWYDGIYVADENTYEEARAAVRALVWQTLGSSIVLAARHGTWQLCPDRSTDAFSSAQARDLAQRVRAFVAANEPRSMLLMGEPGTGKSSILRYVANKTGGRTLRLIGDDLADADPSSLIDILAPTAVVIDDVERVERPDALLRYFEQVRSVTPLFLASVNNIEKLDRAMLRPGRFDDVIGVVQLDDATIDSLLGDIRILPDDEQESLRALPVAYLNHFRQTREVLGLAAAIESIEELKGRAELVASMSDPSETPNTFRGVRRISESAKQLY